MPTPRRRPRFCRMVTFAACLACAAGLPAQKGKAWSDPAAAAAEDPDFALQGEYATPDKGVQVVALGAGRFRVVTYPGGLPGLGWNKGAKTEREVGAAELRQELGEGHQRVMRHSTTLGAAPPAGATVLFDGTEASLANWKPGAKRTDDGLLIAGATSIPKFGDCRVHVEFRLPYMPNARGQGRGNSGLYLQGRFETQMLDSFGLAGKHNECGGIYSVRAPDLNMCLPPLAWQTYDVDLTAARFDDQGKTTSNARMTVRLNGVVVHDDVEVPKSTTASPVKEGPEPGPVYLQDHGNPVRYRNIWVLPK